MPNGTGMKSVIVKWYDQCRGYGFIIVDNGGELFFHATALPDDAAEPRQGERVKFTTGKSRDGKPRAKQVTVVEAQ
jgi:cold shock protein